MQKITSKQFTHIFSDIWNSEDRRFCFILGAGASFSSGIRTGAQLAEMWLSEIKRQLEDQPEKYEEFLKLNKIQLDAPGLSYPQIFQERFQYDYASGLDFINREIENKTPSYGYSVLAQILAEKQHNIIITTNFDNLTEEALYTYTYKRPIICGHESLAAFAKPSVTRPLILKIHRDRFFSPQNLPEEIDNINNLWVEALNNIFSVCTPVFIGYGGNDGSMMGYLDKVTRLNNLFWCEIKHRNVSGKVEGLLKKHNGKLVEIDGFDELMFAIQDRLQLTLLDKEIVKIAEQRADSYLQTVLKIRNQQAKSQDKEVQQAAERMVTKLQSDWWYWERKANTAQSKEEKEKIYREALEKCPDEKELLLNYGNFLFHTNRREEAERWFVKALEIDPDSCIVLNNIGLVLLTVKKDFEEAEKYLKRALEADPQNEYAITQYAYFLSNIKKDYLQAQEYFKKSLKINPYCHVTNGNYAALLFILDKDEEAFVFLENALTFCSHDDLRLELLFYSYSYSIPQGEEVLYKLNELINEGVRSYGLDLQIHVENAFKKGHTHPETVQKLADIITKEYDTTVIYFLS